MRRVIMTTGRASTLKRVRPGSCPSGNALEAINSTSKSCHRVGGKLRAEKVRGLLELEI